MDGGGLEVRVKIGLEVKFSVKFLDRAAQLGAAFDFRVGLEVRDGLEVGCRPHLSLPKLNQGRPT